MLGFQFDFESYRLNHQQLEFVFGFLKESLTCPTKKVGAVWSLLNLGTT